jgi:uncharacterized protein
MPDGSAVLIAAASGRALATSARRAGYVPLVADFFGDQDTLAVAAAYARVTPGNGRSMDANELIPAFEILAAGRRPCGVVCGTGFEDQPELLRRIAQRWLLLGNSPDTVSQIKNPIALARVCRSCGIPHPDTSLAPPENMDGQLAKRIGGAGGTHVRFARSDQIDVADYYYQRRVGGDPVSASVLANGHAAVVLGFSAQWSSPARRRPFRYGGAVRPAALAAETADAMAAAVRRFVSEIPLVGLNSIDFLVDHDRFHLLEVNPRPGATVDIFEPQDGPTLFALHMAACRGELPARLPDCKTAAASAIVYAENDIPLIPFLNWPHWTADRPIAGSRISAQSPVCTVFATAATAAQAKELVVERSQSILARLRARPS